MALSAAVLLALISNATGPAFYFDEFGGSAGLRSLAEARFAASPVALALSADFYDGKAIVRHRSSGVVDDDLIVAGLFLAVTAATETIECGVARAHTHCNRSKAQPSPTSAASRRTRSTARAGIGTPRPLP